MILEIINNGIQALRSMSEIQIGCREKEIFYLFILK